MDDWIDTKWDLARLILPFLVAVGVAAVLTSLVPTRHLDRVFAGILRPFRYLDARRRWRYRDADEINTIHGAEQLKHLERRGPPPGL